MSKTIKIIGGTVILFVLAFFIKSDIVVDKAFADVSAGSQIDPGSSIDGTDGTAGDATGL